MREIVQWPLSSLLTVHVAEAEIGSYIVDWL